MLKVLDREFDTWQEVVDYAYNEWNVIVDSIPLSQVEAEDACIQLSDFLR